MVDLRLLGCEYLLCMSRMLIVEDDEELATIIKDWLAIQKHAVETVADGDDALQMLSTTCYDVIILDLTLQGMGGLTVLKEFRARGGVTPVLILTGRKAVSEKEEGLDAGADDYLTKPFDHRELAARLRALLRRPALYSGDSLEIGDLVLDTAQHKVSRADEEIKLLPREFDVLEFFMRNPDRVFSSEALLRNIWSSESDGSDDAVRSCIKRLRRKIDVEGRPSLISSIYGVGYELKTR